MSEDAKRDGAIDDRDLDDVVGGVNGPFVPNKTNPNIVPHEPAGPHEPPQELGHPPPHFSEKMIVPN